MEDALIKLEEKTEFYEFKYHEGTKRINSLCVTSFFTF